MYAVIFFKLNIEFHELKYLILYVLSGINILTIIFNILFIIKYKLAFIISLIYAIYVGLYYSRWYEINHYFYNHVSWILFIFLYQIAI